jgi:Asp-tRNA(Asn)/Glu-tRNA(Gln) amidotransferase A subunit family amidase
LKQEACFKLPVSILGWESQMADQVVTGTVDSVDAGGEEQSTALDPAVAQQELDAWADEKPNQRAREATGKFAKTKTDTDRKEVGRVLKNTVKGVARQDERQEEEEVQEEEEQVEEQPKPKRKVKGIVNGREEEIDLDDDEFQKVNAVQATRAAQKAWREAAEMRKEANEFRQALEAAKAGVRKDPMALFKALGIPEEDVFNFAREKTISKISETIDPETGQPYTPEQQRIIQLQKQLEAKEQIEQQTRQQQEAAEMEQLKTVVRQDIDRKFTAALEETGLPPTQYTMMRLADLMQSMGPDVDPATVAPLVLEDLVNETRQTIYSMPIEVAAEILGEEWMNELRKWDINKAKAGRDKFGRNPQRYPNNAPQRAPAKGSPRQTSSPGDAQEWLENWAEGRR